MKHTKPSRINMPKCDLCLFILNEFILGTMPPILLYGEKDPYVIGQYESGSKIFSTEDESIEDEEYRGWTCSLDNKMLQTVVEHNPH